MHGIVNDHSVLPAISIRHGKEEHSCDTVNDVLSTYQKVRLNRIGADEVHLDIPVVHIVLVGRVHLVLDRGDIRLEGRTDLCLSAAGRERIRFTVATLIHLLHGQVGEAIVHIVTTVAHQCQEESGDPLVSSKASHLLEGRFDVIGLATFSCLILCELNSRVIGRRDIHSRPGLTFSCIRVVLHLRTIVVF